MLQMHPPEAVQVFLLQNELQAQLFQILGRHARRLHEAVEEHVEVLSLDLTELNIRKYLGYHSLQDVLHHRLAVGDPEQRDVAQPVEVAEVLQLELRLPAGERAHPGHGVHKVLHARRRRLPGVHGEQSQADAALQAEYFGGGQGAEEVV